MGGRILLGVTLAALILAGRPASAGPMRYEVAFIMGLRGTPVGAMAVALPDLSLGGSATLPGGELFRPGPEYQEPNWPAAGTVSDEPFGGDFWIDLRAFDEDAPPGTIPARLTVRGTYQGLVKAPNGLPARIGGWLEGVATSAEVSDVRFGYAPAPEAFLDLAAHPERIEVHGLIGLVGGGNTTVLTNTLTIDPAPVPEPSSLAMLLLASGGFLAHRARRNRA